MKKTILSLAVAAGLAASGAAFAAPTVYGNAHLSINMFDKDDGTGEGTAGNMDLSSNTSSVGVKGSEDLGAGLKAIYKVEFQVDVADKQPNGGALTQRDMWAGLAGGMGNIKLGIMSSNYKQMGGKVDALYRTQAEGRGFINTQSDLHSGRADNRGRMTNTVQYTSPKIGGMSVVVNTTLNDKEDETMGAGFRYESKAFMAYVDYIDTQPIGAALTAGTETAVKIGGKFDADAFFVGAQFEAAEDVTGYDFMHVNAGFSIDANNLITATYGTASHITNSVLDTTGMALAYDHKLSKATDVYVAYMDKSSDDTTIEDSAFTAGLRIKF